jgi:hypothetical protein
VKRWVAAALVALVALALGGCSSGDGSSSPTAAGDTSGASPSPIKTLTMVPVPSRTLSGHLTAELQQSSRDVALGRFQVWITNGLDHPISPRRIVYRDDLLVRPVVGGRLRDIPSNSFRGYTLDLIRPRCGGEEKGASVSVDYGEDVVSIPVEDETQVVGRWAAERCAELAIQRLATLEWSAGFEVQGSGPDAVALFALTAHPTGREGSFTVDTVTGTPLFTSADGAFWTVDQKVDGTGPTVTMELPAHPARCDAHAFGSATGGTTFFVNLTLDSGPAQIRLAMSPAVTNEAFAYAGEVCGF